MTKKNEQLFWQEHAWKYFEIHANQRIVLFRYYIGIFIFFISAIGFLFIRFYQDGILSEISAFAASIIFIIITCIFRLLDLRNRELIHFGEDALREIESNLNSPITNKIFIKEKLKSTCTNHTKCFSALYNTAYIIASLVIVASIISVLVSCPVIPICVSNLFLKDKSMCNSCVIMPRKVWKNGVSEGQMQNTTQSKI